MTVKVYKRTDSARSTAYQDGLLAPIVPGWPDVPTFFDGDRDEMFRPTRRKEADDIYVGSLALLADDDKEIVGVIASARVRGSTIHCAEEAMKINGKTNAVALATAWRKARKTGAAKRGAEMSAKTKKDATAAKLKLIEEDLKKDDYTTRELLDRVGVKSVNSIKNHFGITREQMQVRYQAELKRAERRAQKRGKKAANG